MLFHGQITFAHINQPLIFRRPLCVRARSVIFSPAPPPINWSREICAHHHTAKPTTRSQHGRLCATWLCICAIISTRSQSWFGPLPFWRKCSRAAVRREILNCTLRRALYCDCVCFVSRSSVGVVSCYSQIYTYTLGGTRSWARVHWPR